MRTSGSKTGRLAELSILTAIVIVLQFVASGIRVGPFSISLILLPIVIGATVCGPIGGAWLGFVFGVVVILSGDASAFLVVSPIGTVITCVVRGILAGYVSGLVFSLVSRRNERFAAILAAVTTPVLNTGIFIICCFIFFYDTVAGWGRAMGYDNIGAYMITAFVGLNFVIELLINIILAPAIVRLIKVLKKK